MDASDIHIGDDWLSCPLPDLQSVHLASNALEGQENWKEVVAGLDSIAVQFDTMEMLPHEAAALFEKHLKDIQHATVNLPEPAIIPVCYDDEFSPDLSRVSSGLGLSNTDCIDWHSGLSFIVTIMGFMPGFAYLESNVDVPDIGRLDRPRQRVAAGSIGIIGSQNCIYSFDSPGGWPIIGRTPTRLFDAGNNPPNKLIAGQQITFEAIDRNQFDKLLRLDIG